MSATLTPTIRDDEKMYGVVMEEMLHSYVVSDEFCSLCRQDREERIGAYEEIKLLIASSLAARHADHNG